MLTRIPNKEGDHDQEHQRPVEHVRRPLVLEKIAILTHSKLDDPVNIPHQNSKRRGVQHIQVRLPWNLARGTRLDHICSEANIEDQAAQHGGSEYQKLDSQPSHNDVLPDADRIRLGEQSRAVGLDDETDQIAEDEKGGCMARGNERKAAAVEGLDDARIHHVQRCGEEDGRQEQEDGLQDVGYQGACGDGGGCSGDVADYLDWGGL